MDDIEEGRNGKSQVSNQIDLGSKENIGISSNRDSGLDNKNDAQPNIFNMNQNNQGTMKKVEERDEEVESMPSFKQQVPQFHNPEEQSIYQDQNIADYDSNVNLRNPSLLEKQASPPKDDGKRAYTFG